MNELGTELRRLADKLDDRMHDLEFVRSEIDEPFQKSIGDAWPPNYELLINELEDIVSSVQNISRVLSRMALAQDRQAFSDAYGRQRIEVTR